jgi:hypothetical protein
MLTDYGPNNFTGTGPTPTTNKPQHLNVRDSSPKVGSNKEASVQGGWGGGAFGLTHFCWTSAVFAQQVTAAPGTEKGTSSMVARPSAIGWPSPAPATRSLPSLPFPSFPPTLASLSHHHHHRCRHCDSLVPIPRRTPPPSSPLHSATGLAACLPVCLSAESPWPLSGAMWPLWQPRPRPQGCAQRRRARGWGRLCKGAG